MGKFFDIDGGFFRLLTKIADFIILDVLVIVFSLPIITIGPAITALYYVALKEVKDEEGYLWKSFWKAFKQNFKQGFLIELIMGAIIGILYFDIRVCYNWSVAEGSTGARLLMFVIFGFLVVALAVLIYVFPILSKFSNTVLKTLKNALIMSMKHLPQTIIMMLATYGLTYFTITYPPVVLLTIAVAAYVDAYILSRIFDVYIPKEEQADDESFRIVDDVKDVDDSENIEDK